MKIAIKSELAPNPVGPYSQAIQQGPFLFCSGQVSIDPKTNEVLKGSVKEQTQLVMKNIKAVLNAGGVDFSNIVKTTIFLTDMNDFAQVNEVYATFFKEPFPARSTVAVVGLPKGVNVEIEVLAYKG